MDDYEMMPGVKPLPADAQMAVCIGGPLDGLAVPVLGPFLHTGYYHIHAYELVEMYYCYLGAGRE